MHARPRVGSYALEQALAAQTPSCRQCFGLPLTKIWICADNWCGRRGAHVLCWTPAYMLTIQNNGMHQPTDAVRGLFQMNGHLPNCTPLMRTAA